MEQPQVSKQETEEILRLAKQTLDKSVEGDFVELGCYKGETSILLQRLLKDSGKFSEKKLWLYDSFAGLPEKTSEDSSVAGEAFKAGELFVSKRDVVEKFHRANLPLPVIKKAFFENLDPEKDLPEKIAFAFLDGDLYGSIKTSFRLVLPKLSKDACLIVHDYNNPKLPGVSRAVEEFLRENPKFSLRNQFTLAILSSHE
ncbi:class I SAM-dependent methyltransferase [Candidatus Saccharibacteria bacterium]|nr:class I SAM-dependent methyltransferase [Candidatus Saccharibacteria bacterium]